MTVNRNRFYSKTRNITVKSWRTVHVAEARLKIKLKHIIKTQTSRPGQKKDGDICDDAYRPEDDYLAESATSEYADRLRVLGWCAVYSMNRCWSTGRLLTILRHARLFALRRSTRSEQRRSFGHLLSQNSVHRRPQALSVVRRVYFVCLPMFSIVTAA